jgi:type I restriction enzyme, S subunit
LKSELQKTQFGLISKQWKLVPFENVIIDQQNGLYKSKEFLGKGTKIVKMGNQYGHPRIYNQDMDRYDLTADELKKFQLHYDDLLFSRRSLVFEGAGECSIVKEKDEPLIFESSIIRTTLNKEIANPDFFFYFFQSHLGRQIIRSINEGTSVAGIRGSDLKKILVPLPSLTEQTKIIQIFSKIDDILEKIQNQNKILEQMSQTLFKYWFVDFDEITEFEDSELGQIPKGWKVESLDDEINFLNGIALQNFRPTDEKFFPVIKIKEMKEGISEKTEKAGLYIDPKYIIKNGDILFSWSGSLELRMWHLGDGALNQHIFKVSSEKYNSWFFYQWTKLHLTEFRRIAEGKVTTMGHIQRYHLSEVKILVPLPKILEKYDLILQPMFDQILKNKLESELLIKIRFSLLAKLMSGEIRV